MNGAFRQSMSWLHTWVGLVLGWLLYFMFITGTLGYFDTEIDRWMRPEVPMAQGINQQQMITLAEQRLQHIAPDAPNWWVDLPAGRSSSLRIWWQNPTDPESGKEGDWVDEKLDPRSGKAITVRETGGGLVLYRMHYALHYLPRVLAYWLTSLAAMFMLLALITGIVIHKKIFKDFFTFRPGKKQRSWLDMHNLLSVLPLPFHLMITYSGLILLMFTTMPGTILANYGLDKADHDRFSKAVFAEDQQLDAAGIAANNISFGAVLPEVETRWKKNQIAYISIENRGDINAHIEVGRAGYDSLAEAPKLTYSAVNGELQHSHDANKTDSAVKFYDVLVDLHEGLFAGPLLRWLYFLSGLMGAGMVATGLILWAVKRRKTAEKTPNTHRGLVLVERLNVGAIVGVPAAVAMYFWANRLLPVSVSGRADWEVHTLFITLVFALCYPLWRPVLRAWVEMLYGTAVLFALLPLVNAVTTQQHLGHSLMQGDWVMAGFDLTSLMTGLILALVAYQVSCKYPPNNPATSRAAIKMNTQGIAV